MELADFIDRNRDRLIARWRQYAVERLSLDLDESELLDHLPVFLEDVARALRAGPGADLPVASAEQHGRQRLSVGAGIGSLTQEMNLVGAAVVELAARQGVTFPADQVVALLLLIGRGAACSVATYAGLRDRELADQAAQHFSFIAHEIRNPLHTAQLAAEALGRSPDDQREDHARRLQRALKGLAGLVDDALVEARLYGDPRLNLEKLRALELVAEVQEDLGGQVAEKNLVIEGQIEDFVLEADRTLLRSALLNVLRNAVRSTCEGGRIDIAARHASGVASFEVRDQCGGIPDELLPRLFQPFAQAHPDRGGSGLGLMIVKQAMEAHGGAVRVENFPGDGCSFRLELPLTAR